MVSAQLLELLACPVCTAGLAQAPDVGADGNGRLRCLGCSAVYPVVDGIPVLFPVDLSAGFEGLFSRYWDDADRAASYAGGYFALDSQPDHPNIFAAYNHKSELEGITRLMDPHKLGKLLDAGCGSARFLEQLAEVPVRVGADASLNLLRLAKSRNPQCHFVCCELEHLPFKTGTFDTVISCRVLQHLEEQARGIAEMVRTAAVGGDIILEVYNQWNLKTIYKEICMRPRLAQALNTPFKLVRKQWEPFIRWNLTYDHYNSWFELNKWLRDAGADVNDGTGVGFGVHRYAFDPFYVFAVAQRVAPKLQRRYLNSVLEIERAIGRHAPFVWTMEKFAIRATKQAVALGSQRLPHPLRKQVQHVREVLGLTAPAKREIARVAAGKDVVRKDDRFHLAEAIAWFGRGQDASGTDGVPRAYALHAPTARPGKPEGWQAPYPEVTGYIIPTLYDAAKVLADPALAERATRMAVWEASIQLPSGAVMGGVLQPDPTPAVFNTGQVMFGWLRALQATQELQFAEALTRAAAFLVDAQEADGSWRKGNSQFANATTTVYNTRVAHALLLWSQQSGDERAKAAALRNVAWALGQQNANGWFRNNCLDQPYTPLLHTICYAIEGILGCHEGTGDAAYRESVVCALEPLAAAVDSRGFIAGRLDAQWQGAVSWACLTGSSQLAWLLLHAARLGLAPTAEQADVWRGAADRLLQFVKGTQNCVSKDGGLRGGIKGSEPFDGDYGRLELLSWATKFFADALMERIAVA